MRMKFIGDYTNGRTTITYLGCTFEGHEAREVSAEVFAHLENHPEFEVDGEAHRKRGRPKKVAD